MEVARVQRLWNLVEPSLRPVQLCQAQVDEDVVVHGEMHPPPTRQRLHPPLLAIRRGLRQDSFLSLIGFTK